MMQGKTNWAEQFKSAGRMLPKSVIMGRAASPGMMTIAVSQDSREAVIRENQEAQKSTLRGLDTAFQLMGGE